MVRWDRKSLMFHLLGTTCHNTECIRRSLSPTHSRQSRGFLWNTTRLLHYKCFCSSVYNILIRLWMQFHRWRPFGKKLKSRMSVVEKYIFSLLSFNLNWKLMLSGPKLSSHTMWGPHGGQAKWHRASYQPFSWWMKQRSPGDSRLTTVELLKRKQKKQQQKNHD